MAGDYGNFSDDRKRKGESEEGNFIVPRGTIDAISFRGFLEGRLSWAGVKAAVSGQLILGGPITLDK